MTNTMALPPDPDHCDEAVAGILIGLIMCLAIAIFLVP